MFVNSLSCKVQKTRTLRSLSSENVSTMIPNIMFKPIVVMKIKNETWYKTTHPNFANDASV